MNVVVENLPNCITTLKVEVEPAKVSKVWDDLAGTYTKMARIPGYRAGKAPKAIIEKKFSKEIREELEKKLLSEACKEAIQEKGLKVISLTQVDDVEIADDKTMKFTATLVTRPDFQLPTESGATWTCTPLLIASLRASSSAETRSVPAARSRWLASADDRIGMATAAIIVTMRITASVSVSVKPDCERNFIEGSVRMVFSPTSSRPANDCRRCRSTAPGSDPSVDYQAR